MKKFVDPKVEVEVYDVEDIITTSKDGDQTEEI